MGMENKISCVANAKFDLDAAAQQWVKSRAKSQKSQEGRESPKISISKYQKCPKNGLEKFETFQPSHCCCES
jgi:hypothetical protein